MGWDGKERVGKGATLGGGTKNFDATGRAVCLKKIWMGHNKNWTFVHYEEMPLKISDPTAVAREGVSHVRVDLHAEVQDRVIDSHGKPNKSPQPIQNKVLKGFWAPGGC